MPRVDRITVMLEQDIKERFQGYASAMGLTASALGAYLIGQYVNQQESAKPMQEALTKKVMEVVEEQLMSIKDLVMGGENDEQEGKEENQASRIVPLKETTPFKERLQGCKRLKTK